MASAGMPTNHRRPISTGNPNRNQGSFAGLALLGMVALSACDGPNEEAGIAQDKAAAAAAGVQYSGDGPNERIGEAEDRAAAAEQGVKDAEANALRAQGDDIERKADVEASRLDEQSRAIRDAADKRADALEDQARAAQH